MQSRRESAAVRQASAKPDRPTGGSPCSGVCSRSHRVGVSTSGAPLPRCRALARAELSSRRAPDPVSSWLPWLLQAVLGVLESVSGTRGWHEVDPRLSSVDSDRPATDGASPLLLDDRYLRSPDSLRPSPAVTAMVESVHSRLGAGLDALTGEFPRPVVLGGNRSPTKRFARRLLTQLWRLSMPFVWRSRRRRPNFRPIYLSEVWS